MNHKIPFKNEDALKKLSVGDTLDGNSGLGGSFTYQITQRTVDGLTLQRDDQEGGLLTNTYSWAELQSQFYVNPSYSISLYTNLYHLELMKKAGYTEPDEIKEALGCTLLDVTEGLKKDVDVYQALISADQPPALFANEHDATLISEHVKPITLSNEAYLTGNVYKNLMSYDIDDVCQQLEAETPDDINIGHMFILATRELAGIYRELMYTGGHQDAIDSPLMMQPNTDALKGQMAQLLKASFDTNKLSQPTRGQHILNTPSSYRQDGPGVKGTTITLMVNDEPMTFNHAKIHNNLSVLHSDELGTLSAELCEELKPLIEDALKQSKKTPAPSPASQRPSLQR